jgi:ADP-ribose pyrophosphatase YjhB (NUDIX family)
MRRRGEGYTSQVESVHDTHIENERDAPTKDVRLFLLQSKLPETLSVVEGQSDSKTIASIQFTEAFFARKKSRVGEPDRIVPIGGAVEIGESLHEASIRRVVEQTHVRPTTVSHTPMPTVEVYSYTSPGEHEVKKREVTYATARLLPRDKGYALDPTRNKIEEYVGFSIPEWEEFLRTGVMTTKDGVEVVLTGSLMLRVEDRLSMNTITESSDVEAVHREFLTLFRLTEADKKLHVLKHLLKRGRGSFTSAQYGELSARVDEFVVKFDTVITGLPEMFRQFSAGNSTIDRDELDRYHSIVEDYYTGVTALWSDIATHYTIDQLKESLEHSNLAVELRFATNERFDMATGRGFPTIDLLLPVLIGDRQQLSFREKKIIMQNPRARNLLRLLESIRSVYDGDNTSSDDILSIIEASGLVEMRGGHTDVRDLSTRLDQYFDHLLFEKVSEEDTDSPLRQDPEVLTYSEDDPDGDRILERLVGLSFRIALSSEEKVTRFEAQRKLALILMLHEGLMEKDRVLDIGIDEIRHVERAIFGVDESSDAKMMDTTIRLNIGGVDRDLSLGRATRTKSDLELLRKMIARDMGIGESDRISDITSDTYGEAIVIKTADDEVMREVDVSDIVSTITGESEIVVAPAVVRAYLDRLREVSVSRGVDISFIDFKPLPREGESFASSSAGGGDTIRMLKFDILHREETDDGELIERYREVQMFLPKKSMDGTWVSGENDYQDKKAKDRVYGVKRLFMTRDSIKSFIELMFPTEIYGNAAQNLYTDKIG